MAGGRPTKYRQEYCERLVKHMAGGNSFETFGVGIGTHRGTLYNWEDEHAEFLDAKKRGIDANLVFWENLAKAGAAGQLKRVASETPVLDDQGETIIGKDGQPVVKRRFAPAVFNATVWIFTMKNIHRWRDRTDVRISDGRQDDLEDMSLAELENEGKRLLAEISKAKSEEQNKKR